MRIFPMILFLVACAGMLLLPAARLAAQGPSPAPEQPAPEQPAADQPATDQPADTSPPSDSGGKAPSELDSQLLDDLDSQLLDGLDAPRAEPAPSAAPASPLGGADAKDATAAEAEDDPLLDIGRRMRTVEQRIAGYDTSEPTQDLQRQIVSDLEKLIEQMKKQCSGSSDKQPPGSQGGGSRSGGQGTQAAEQAASQPARESTDRLGNARNDRVDGQQVEDLVKQVWGHLPPKVRELMRSASVEEFLPKYEQQIEAYYRRLAEEE